MSSDDDQLPDEEIARRMERGKGGFLKTPPQPLGKNPKTSPPTPNPEERRRQRNAATTATRMSEDRYRCFWLRLSAVIPRRGVYFGRQSILQVREGRRRLVGCLKGGERALIEVIELLIVR
jgi:hypothetical protein